MGGDREERGGREEGIERVEGRRGRISLPEKPNIDRFGQNKIGKKPNIEFNVGVFSIFSRRRRKCF